MSIEDTRKLAIEFERRVQTMIPEKEFIDKLDSDTIYSFLNQCQDQIVSEIYRNIDRFQNGTTELYKVESVLQSLIVDNYSPETITRGDNYITFSVEQPIFMYIRSTSTVTESYRYKYKWTGNKVVPNILVSQIKIQELLDSSFNELRILRSPVIAISGDRKFTIIHDRYTNISNVSVTYYRKPRRFNYAENISCELPEIIFEDLVTGAINLYIQYVAGAEANKKAQLNAA